MGVVGLFSYIQAYADVALEWFKLHNCKLVIDGNNLVHELYNNSDPNPVFGGDYVEFSAVVEKFFKRLLKCKIEAYVIMDGGHPTERSKFITLRERAITQIKNGISINPENHKLNQLFPIMGYNVFIDVVQRMGIPLIRCDFEADDEIVVLARHLNASIVSNDSDFFLFDVPFILLNRMNMKNIQKQRMDDGTLSYFIPCYRFNLDLFCEITQVPKYLVPLMGPLLGNDIVRPSALSSFHKSINDLRPIGKGITERHRVIISFMRWLSYQNGHRAEDVLAKALHMGNFDYRKKERIYSALDMYYPSESNLLPWAYKHRSKCPAKTVWKGHFKNHSKIDYKRGSFMPPRVSAELKCTCADRLNCDVVADGLLPNWFVKTYRLCQISPIVTDIFNKDFLFAFPQVETLQWLHSYSQLEFLLRNIRGLLWHTVFQGLSIAAPPLPSSMEIRLSHSDLVEYKKVEVEKGFFLSLIGQEPNDRFYEIFLKEHEKKKSKKKMKEKNKNEINNVEKESVNIENEIVDSEKEINNVENGGVVNIENEIVNSENETENCKDGRVVSIENEIVNSENDVINCKDRINDDNEIIQGESVEYYLHRDEIIENENFENDDENELCDDLERLKFNANFDSDSDVHVEDSDNEILYGENDEHFSKNERHIDENGINFCENIKSLNENCKEFIKDDKNIKCSTENRLYEADENDKLQENGEKDKDFHENARISSDIEHQDQNFRKSCETDRIKKISENDEKILENNENGDILSENELDISIRSEEINGALSYSSDNLSSVDDFQSIDNNSDFDFESCDSENFDENGENFKENDVNINKCDNCADSFTSFKNSSPKEENSLHYQPPKKFKRKNSVLENFKATKLIPQIHWYVRKGRALGSVTIKKQPVTCFSYLPNLFKVDEYSVAEKRRAFFSICELNIDLKSNPATNTNTNLKNTSNNCDIVEDIPANIEFILYCICFWQCNYGNHTKHELILSCLMGILMFCVIDGKIGRNSGYKQFQTEDFSMKVIKSKIKGSDDPAELSIKDLIDSLTREECLKAKLSLYQFLSVQPKITRKSFDRNVVHAFSEYKACIEYLRTVNALLCFPYPNINIESFWNGTFCYNIAQSLFSRKMPVHTILNTLFENNTRITCLYIKLYQSISKQTGLSTSVNLKPKNNATLPDEVKNKLIQKERKKLGLKSREQLGLVAANRKKKKKAKKEIKEMECDQEMDEENLELMAENQYTALLIVGNA